MNLIGLRKLSKVTSIFLKTKHKYFDWLYFNILISFKKKTSN